MVCLQDFQETTPPPSVNTYPLVDLISSTSEIQFSDADRLSVTSFAATLKPNVFDGSNYKRWKQRVTYWLTAMSIGSKALEA
jgi:hypothetical protein